MSGTQPADNVGPSGINPPAKTPFEWRADGGPPLDVYWGPSRHTSLKQRRINVDAHRRRYDVILRVGVGGERNFISVQTSEGLGC